MKRTAPGHEYLNAENETALMEAYFMISIWENTDESNPMHSREMDTHFKDSFTSRVISLLEELHGFL